MARLKNLSDAARVYLARLVLRVLFDAVDSRVNPTKRCPGCGYFEGEPQAGEDHYGYSCRFIDIPWYSPVFEWAHGRKATIANSLARVFKRDGVDSRCSGDPF